MKNSIEPKAYHCLYCGDPRDARLDHPESEFRDYVSDEYLLDLFLIHGPGHRFEPDIKQPIISHTIPYSI